MLTAGKLRALTEPTMTDTDAIRAFLAEHPQHTAGVRQAAAHEFGGEPRDATPEELSAWEKAGRPYPPPWAPEKRAWAGTCKERSGA